MKNEHLIPPGVLDIIEKVRKPNIRENEKLNLTLRLEASRDAINETLEEINKPTVFNFQTRKIKS